MRHMRMSDEPVFKRAEAALRAVLPRGATVRAAVAPHDLMVNGVAIRAQRAPRPHR